jgi:hypothetical protein
VILYVADPNISPEAQDAPIRGLLHSVGDNLLCVPVKSHPYDSCGVVHGGCSNQPLQARSAASRHIQIEPKSANQTRIFNHMLIDLEQWENAGEMQDLQDLTLFEMNIGDRATLGSWLGFRRLLNRSQHVISRSWRVGIFR